RGHHDDTIHIVGSGKSWLCVVVVTNTVDAAIACRHHEKLSRVARCLNHIKQSLGVRPATPTVVQYASTVLISEVNALYGVIKAATALGIQKLHGHYSDIPSNPHMVSRIVRRSTYRPRHVRPMPVVIHRVTTVCDRVDAV